MSVFLTYQDGGDEGGAAAQTGNLVHAAAKAFHDHKDEEAGRAALEAARLQFPDGDPARALEIFGRYAADPKNRDADVVWCEAPVRLVLAPDPADPTGEPVVIEGTLDQVRREAGALTVWDIKTGSRLSPEESLDEYLVQQVIYVLAARQTLDPAVGPGGLIYTPGYDKPRGRRFLPYDLDETQLRLAASAVVAAVAQVRRGVPDFRPGPEACRYCPLKPFRNCTRHFRGHYGETRVQHQDPDREGPDDRDRQGEPEPGPGDRG